MLQKGETIWDLAKKKYHVDPAEILRLNKISDPNDLQIAESLVEEGRRDERIVVLVTGNGLKDVAAALLDQERPNIFTQSVTNIMPGASVRIVISYVEVLKYEEGHYEFMFPMVVGPRYIPGRATGRGPGGC